MNIIKHKSVMTQVLKEIYSHKNLGPILGFKGGTAAFLFYDLPRFSVDLDFNLLDSTKEEMVLKEIKEILTNFGQVEGGGKLKIKISRRNDSKDKYEVLSWMGIPMLVMIKEDMFYHKLHALTERKVFANRDLFDVWFFIKENWPCRKIEKNYLNKCLKVVEKLDNRYILQGLGELLDEKQKVWVKNHLQSETIFQIKNLL